MGAKTVIAFVGIGGGRKWGLRLINKLINNPKKERERQSTLTENRAVQWKHRFHHCLLFRIVERVKEEGRPVLLN